MPQADRPLDALNRLAAKARCWIDIDAEFDLPDARRLVVYAHNLSDTMDTKGWWLEATARGADGVPTGGSANFQHRTLSAALRSLHRQFPGAALPPAELQVRCSGSPLSTPAVKKLLLAGFAQAFGRELPASWAAAGKPASTDPAEWVGALRSGPSGLRKWNRLKADARASVDLGGADLAGLDLNDIKFRGVRARGASFAGANLARADLSGGQFDGADFAGADLGACNFQKAGAAGAVFRDAGLPRADLRHATLVGASFAGADLSGADLSNAHLQRADLAGAVLDGALLEGASFDAQTAWPDGFTLPADLIFAGRGTDPRLVGKGKSAVAADVNGLMARLHSLIDPKRMKRTLDMLKSGKNQLFAEVEPDHVRGVVRSQRDEDLIYSCVLTEGGAYACCTPDLALCMGLRGEPCKHLLVLLIGLARAGRLDPATVDRWLLAAAGKNHRWNKSTKNHVSDTLLRYKGVEAGEVDWRPTETIPEDFYAM